MYSTHTHLHIHVEVPIEQGVEYLLGVGQECLRGLRPGGVREGPEGQEHCLHDVQPGLHCGHLWLGHRTEGTVHVLLERRQAHYISGEKKDVFGVNRQVEHIGQVKWCKKGCVKKVKNMPHEMFHSHTVYTCILCTTLASPWDC